MKTLTKLMLTLTLIAGISSAQAADNVKKEETKSPPKPVAQDVLYLGLPINNSGISMAGRPDRLNFVTIKSDNSIEIDWKNVCLITNQHPFNVQELQKIQGNPEDFILPYAIKSANPDHKC